MVRQINLTPEQEQIVNDELKSGHFRSAEEVIAKTLVALREKVRSSLADDNGHHDDAVREMLKFVEIWPRSLAGHLCSDPRESPSVSDLVLDARRWRSSGF